MRMNHDLKSASLNQKRSSGLVNQSPKVQKKVKLVKPKNDETYVLSNNM